MATKAVAETLRETSAEESPVDGDGLDPQTDLATVNGRVQGVTGFSDDCHQCFAQQECDAARLMSALSALEDMPQWRTETLPRGQHLFYDGALQEAVCFIKTGSVKTCKTSTTGDEQVLGFHLPGDMLGNVALFDNRGYETSAIALEDTTVCIIPAARLERMVMQAPAGTQWLLERAGSELVRYQRMLVVINNMGAEARMAYFLLDLARRFCGRGYSSREYNLTMSRQDIANYLGLAVETVSRVMRRFKKDGLIDIHHRRGIAILDPAGLADR